MVTGNIFLLFWGGIKANFNEVAGQHLQSYGRLSLTTLLES
jgi:hypothetical protein